MSRISELLSMMDDFLIWFNEMSESPWQTTWRVALGLGLTFALMLLVWEIFVPLGRILGRLMSDHPRTIWAYSVNVAGSLVGIWLFVALSALYMPPYVWFLVAGAMLLAYLGRGQQRLVNAGILATVVVMSWLASREPTAQQVAWSPYQKLVLSRTNVDQPDWTHKYRITVNNVGYQAILDLSQASVQADRRIQPASRGLSQYDIPLLLHPQPRRVLIVGAGAGNDAAGALRGGAEQVTAVEIDPAIIEMGRRNHPERPYQSARVKVVNDDARSFLATTQEKFDLVIFGLLDSHTMTAMTNARLDHYVYTRQSIARARSLLAERGVMVLSFEAAKPYIANRMAQCLKDVFGFEPMTFRIPSSASGWGGLIFVTGDPQVVQNSLAGNQRLAEQIAEWQAAYPLELNYGTTTTTDDWPYIYLENPRIPTLYYLLGALMVAMIVYCKRRLKAPGLLGGWNKSHWHFFSWAPPSCCWKCKTSARPPSCWEIPGGSMPWSSREF